MLPTITSSNGYFTTTVYEMGIIVLCAVIVTVAAVCAAVAYIRHLRTPGKLHSMAGSGRPAQRWIGRETL